MLPSKHAVCLPNSALVCHLHVRPEQHAVDGSCYSKVVRLHTNTFLMKVSVFHKSK